MRESMLARLARLTVRSCLKPALQPTFPVPVQRHWANIATRTLSVPFGVRFSQSRLGACRQKSCAPNRTHGRLAPYCSCTAGPS
jgi:hypothetical protein